MAAPRTLGINGLGRIGKLTLWYHLAHDDFDTFVVNVGRPVGTSLQSVLEYLSKDSTYGPLHRWLGGCYGKRDLQVIDEAKGLCKVHGKDVIILRTGARSQRHPLAGIRRHAGGRLHRQVPGSLRRRQRRQGRAPRPPGRRSPGGRDQLPVQEQGEGRPAARGHSRPYPRDQPPRLRSRARTRSCRRRPAPPRPSRT